VALILLLLLAAGCSNTAEEAEGTPTPPDRPLTIEVDGQANAFPVGTEGFSVTYGNPTDETIMTGYMCTFEKKSGAGWTPVPLPDDVAFPAVGINIAPEGSETFEIDLHQDQLEWTAGDYRIRREFSYDSKTRGEFLFDFSLTG
jgi:hypothetical protein